MRISVLPCLRLISPFWSRCRVMWAASAIGNLLREQILVPLCKTAHQRAAFGDLGPLTAAGRTYRSVVSEGGFAAGPLLFPGRPGTFAGSCCPLVAEGDPAGGPFLLPGWPGIPAPEFPLGTCPDSPVCDIADDAITASASAAAASLNMGTSSGVCWNHHGPDFPRARSL
jgi:hypothetical protein